MENNTAKRGRPAAAKEQGNKDYSKIIEEQNNTIEELKKMLVEMKASQNNSTKVQTLSYTNMMDKPCTIIHLWECTPGLPTTISVRGIPFSFTKFGEKRIFRFEDIQMIVSHYRDFFDRGVFTLGEDCEEFKDSLGVDLMSVPMSVSKYNKIAEMPQEEFESIVNSINMSQRIILAKTWVKRYNEGDFGYDNMSKISFLNKKTDGFLDQFIEKDMRNR